MYTNTIAFPYCYVMIDSRSCESNNRIQFCSWIIKFLLSTIITFSNKGKMYFSNCLWVQFIMYKANFIPFLFYEKYNTFLFPLERFSLSDYIRSQTKRIPFIKHKCYAIGECFFTEDCMQIITFIIGFFLKCLRAKSERLEIRKHWISN